MKPFMKDTFPSDLPSFVKAMPSEFFVWSHGYSTVTLIC